MFKPDLTGGDIRPPLSQEWHTAAMRQLQWRSEWIKYGEEIIRGYQHADPRAGYRRDGTAQ